MKIKLHKASMLDCNKIHQIQVRAFKRLLDKYGDLSTNPGAEKVEQVERRFEQVNTDYYIIYGDDEMIGAIRIVKRQGNVCRLSPIFILPEFQGKGYAQQAIISVESLYPAVVVWQLDTIKEEPALCHLYEKMGYKPTGKEKSIQDHMTLVDYEKRSATEL